MQRRETEATEARDAARTRAPEGERSTEDRAMYHRLLVPTDGSPGTDRAVEHALDVATRYDAELHVLYVVNANALPIDAHTRRGFEYLEAEGRFSVVDIADRATDLGIDPVVTEVSVGSPHEVILAYIDDHDIDLVVMGTHGRQGLDRYLLGSVTERVVRSTDVPVLTVKLD